MNALEKGETLESEPVVSCQQLSEIARGRSRVYTVLSEVLNQMPSLELLRTFRRAEPLWSAIQGDVGAAAAAVLRQTLSQVPSDDAAGALAPNDLVTGLAVERTRFLRGVKPGYGLPPACESVYRRGLQKADLEPQEPGRAWVDMLAEYRRNGFSTPKGLQPDYIGVEVSFLSFLSHLEAVAWVRDDSSAALAAAGREADFLDEHPLSWVNGLVSRVAAEAFSPFWPALLTLLGSHLRMDRDYLGELLGGLAPRRDDA